MGFNGGKSIQDTGARKLAARLAAATMPRELVWRTRQATTQPMRVVSVDALGLNRRTDNGE